MTTQDKGKRVTIVAEHHPGDQSVNYTSPWAGANFSFASESTEQACHYDKLSYENFAALFEKFGEEAGLRQLPTQELWEDEPPSDYKVQSMKSYIPDFKILSKQELPAGKIFGVKYTTFNFNAPKFLLFLKAYLIKHGVTFVRQRVTHVNEAFLSPSTKAVFNCTGIGAYSLGGVEDKNMYPIRGQVVVVSADFINYNIMSQNEHYVTYIIPRPGKNNHVILGGYYQPGNWSGDTNSYETESILERAAQLVPELKTKPYEIIREAAGLRPGRKGGTRIEKEYRENGRVIIHNYGAAGAGYQSGYGMALEALKLMKDDSRL